MFTGRGASVILAIAANRQTDMPPSSCSSHKHLEMGKSPVVLLLLVPVCRCLCGCRCLRCHLQGLPLQCTEWCPQQQ
jgi:hypothetical protein